MNKESLHYIAKALDKRIKDLGDFINTKKNIVKQMEWEIKNKQSKSDGMISMAYYEDVSTSILNESKEKIATQQPHLDGYIKARAELKKEFNV